MVRLQLSQDLVSVLEVENLISRFSCWLPPTQFWEPGKGIAHVTSVTEVEPLGQLQRDLRQWLPVSQQARPLASRHTRTSFLGFSLAVGFVAGA